MKSIVKGLWISSVLLMFTFQGVSAATFTSVQDGDWGTGSTWDLDPLTPGASDDVIVGHIVTLPGNQTIVNVQITAAGELNCNGSTLTITGNLNNAGIWTAPGAVTFSGASASTIDFTGSGAFGVFTMNKTGTGTADDVTINDDINIAVSFTITDGEFILGSNTLAMTGNMLIQDAGSFNAGTGSVSWTSNGAYTVSSDIDIDFYDVVHTYSSFDGSRTLTFQQRTGAGSPVFTIENSLTRGGQTAAVNQGTGADIQYDTATLIYTNTVNMNVGDEWPEDANGPDRVELNGSSARTVNINDEDPSADVVVLGSGTLNINSGQELTINTDGTLEVQEGSIAVNGTLTYSTGSTLKYNSSSEYAVDEEWTTTLTPTNVEIAGSGAELITNHSASTLAVGIDGGAAADGDITFNAILRHDNTLQVRGDVTGGSGNFGVANNGTLELVDNEDTAIDVANTFTVRNFTVNKPSGTATVTSGSTLRMDANSVSSTLNIADGTLIFATTATALSLVNGGTHTLDIDANATLQTGGKSISGFTYVLDAASTVIFNGNSTETIPATSYGNITVNNSTATNNINLAGNITLKSGATLNVTSGELNLGGNTLTKSGTNTLTIGSSGLLRTANSSGTSVGTDITGFTTYNLTGELVFNGNTGNETLPSGVTSDAFDLTVNKSGGGVVMGGAVSFGGDGQVLTLSNGSITTTGANTLTLLPGTSVSGGSGSSFISGPVIKQYNASFLGNVTDGTGLIPVGKGSDYRPVKLAFGTAPGTFGIKVEQFNADANPNPDPPTGYTDFYTGRYWQIELNSGTSGGSATLILDYNGYSPTAPAGVRIVKGDDNSDFNISGTYSGLSGTEVTHNAIAGFGSTDVWFALAQLTGTRYWDGGGGDNAWTTAANWVDNIAPSPGDNVVLDHTHGASSTYIVVLSSSVSIGDLEINPTSGTITLNLDNTASSLTISNSSAEVLTVNSNGIITLEGPTSSGIILSGTSPRFSFASGSYYNIYTGSGISGHTSSNSTFDQFSEINVTSNNSSAIVADDYGILTVSNSSGSISTSAPSGFSATFFTMDGTGDFSITGDLTVSFDFYKNSTGDMTVTGNLTANSGTPTVDGGTLTVTDGTMSVTNFTVSSGTVTSNGTGNITASGTMTTSGSGTLVSSGSGNSTFNALNNGSNFQVGPSAGTTTFNSTVANTGTMTLTGSGAGLVTFNGAYSGTGSIAANVSEPNVTFASTFSPSGNCTFGSQTLLLQNNVTLSSGTFTPSSNTTFTGSSIAASGGQVSTTAGEITFSGAGAQTTTGALALHDVTINKSANNVTLGSTLALHGDLTLTQGDIVTSASNLLTFQTGATVTDGSNNSHIDGPAAKITNNTNTFTFPVGTGDRWRRIAIQAASSTSQTYTVEYFFSDPGEGGRNRTTSNTGDTDLDHISVNQYWTVDRSGSVNANITLHWEDVSDGVDVDKDDLVVAQWINTSSFWESRGGSASGGLDSPGSVRSNEVSSFGVNKYFTLGSSTTDNALPVELASFEALGNYGDVTLNWVTSSEIENLGFNILRSTAEENSWIQVNESMISGQGNSSEEASYQFVDGKVVSGETYSYKLESVSLNGAVEVEKTVEVLIPVPAEFALLNNYPNPFNPRTNIKFQLPEASQVSVNIYDIGGKLIKQLVHNQTYQAGEFVVQWDARDESQSKVASGMYVYHFKAGTFSKLGKMVLVK